MLMVYGHMGFKASEQLRRNLIALIEAHHVKQKDMAFAIKKSATVVSKFLRGGRDELQLQDLDALADFFGIQLYELLEPGGSRHTDRRKGPDRRLGKERRVGHARRLLKTLSGEVTQSWRKAHPQHGETVPGDWEVALTDLATRFEQEVAAILEASDTNARRQAASDRRPFTATPPAVRSPRQPRTGKA